MTLDDALKIALIGLIVVATLAIATTVAPWILWVLALLFALAIIAAPFALIYRKWRWQGLVWSGIAAAMALLGVVSTIAVLERHEGQNLADAPGGGPWDEYKRDPPAPGLFDDLIPKKQPALTPVTDPEILRQLEAPAR